MVMIRLIFDIDNPVIYKSINEQKVTLIIRCDTKKYIFELKRYFEKKIQ